MLLVIFIFSGMSSDDSNSRSKTIVRNSISIVNKVFDLDLTDEKINNIVTKYNYPFRKFCHFFEYFILSILIILSLRLANISVNKSIIITIVFCLIFSISDEIHQMFVSERSPLITDCVIDTFGSILFCIIYYLKTKLS